MKLTMFYDSSCTLCRSEAMSLWHLSGGDIIVISVSDGQNELAQAGISYQEAMTHLCVKDEWGAWYKGMEAVRVLYKTANIRLFGVGAFWLFNLPVIYALLNIAYPYFAKRRHLIPAYLVKWWYGAVYDIKLNKINGLCDTGNCYIYPKP